MDDQDEVTKTANPSASQIFAVLAALLTVIFWGVRAVKQTHHVDGCRQGKVLDHGYTHLRDNGLRLGQPGVEYWNPAEKTLVRVVGPKPGCVDDWSLVTCRNCLAKHEKHTNDINELDRLQAEAGGIQCVQEIIVYLRRGERQRAAHLRRYEGDKTRTHPAVERQLRKMFGCRLHGVQGCDKRICQRSPT